MIKINRDNVNEHCKDFKKYVKFRPTKICRVHEPFIVETIHGEVTCYDGYIGIDSQGFPYPIDADEFLNIYRPMKPTFMRGHFSEFSAPFATEVD